MRRTKLFITLLSVLAITAVSTLHDERSQQRLVKDVGSTCFEWVNQAGYRFDTLELADDYTATIDNIANSTVTFDICGQVKESNQCSKDNKTYAVMNDDKSCHTLTSSKMFSNFEYNAIDENNPEKGVTVLFKGGDEITPTNSYAFKLILNCDLNYNDSKSPLNITSATQEQTENLTTITVTTYSVGACPLFSMGQLEKFIIANKYIFIAIFACIGIFVAFLGRKMLKPTLFLIGFLLTFLLLMFILFFIFVDDTTAVWAKWIVLICSLLLGGVVGYLAYISDKLGLFLVGAFLGYIGGTLLYLTIIVQLYDNHAQVVEIVIEVISAIVCGVLASIWEKHIVIISTSLGGSTMVLRAVSLIAGGWPSGSIIAEIVQSEDWSMIPYNYWIYFGGIILLTLGSCIFQYKQNVDKKEDDKTKDGKLYHGMV